MVVDLASTAIGATSLTFQVFSGCIYAFHILRTARRIDKDAAAIICMLSWAEWRLVVWSKESGLYEDEMRCTPKEEVLIRATLSEIDSLISNATALKGRFKLDLREDNDKSNLDADTGTPSMPSDIQQAGDNEVFGRFPASVLEREELSRILERARQAKSRNALPKRFFWAACEKDNFQQLVNHIHIFIDQLTMYLGRTQRQELDRKLQTILLRTVEMTEHIPDLLALVDAARSQENPQNPYSHQVGDLARTRALRISLGLGDEGTGQVRSIVQQRTIDSHSTDPIEIDMDEIVRENPHDKVMVREIASYQDQQVYVEWKAIRDRRHVRKLKPRIQALCRVLRAPKSPSFCSLRCRGVAEVLGEDKYAMVFDLPSWWQTTGSTCTLKDCLSWDSFRPSANVRRILALQLCTTLLNLHVSGWVHKAICSSNVSFFHSVKPQQLHQTNLLERPFVVGYEYARFDDPSQSSELQSSVPEIDIYRHPDLLGNDIHPFIKKHDIYAMGLMMLEIGIFTPLESILVHFVDIKKEPTSPKISQVREYVLGRVEQPAGYTVLQALRFHMGDTYTNIVESCLDGASFDSTTDQNRGLETSTERFNETVVHKLQEMIL